MVEESENAFREWGFTYGLAYGIARGEDPEESDELTARRAREAADAVFRDDAFQWLVFIRWAEDPAGPETEEVA